jgi:serine protease DegQ
VLQAQFLGHTRRDSRSAITLSGVVPASQKSHACFFGQMGLRFGYFTGDEGVHAPGNGCLKVALRATRAPSDTANGPITVTDASHRTPQHHRDMVGQRLGARPNLCACAHESQILLTESPLNLKAQHTGQLGVVAQFSMGVEWQVVSKQVDAVGQQQTQPLPHPAGDAPVLAPPEQAVVYQNGIGIGFNRSLDQGPAGRDATDQQAHITVTFNLQSIGAVIAELVGLEQVVKGLAQNFGVGHQRGFQSWVGIVAQGTTGDRPNQGQSATMKRYWLLFSQWVTVLLAVWFVVATLQPEWLRSAQRSADGMTLLQAPAGSPLNRPAGSLSAPARQASPAVVSINTSKANSPSAQSQDPWFKFFYGEQEEQSPAGLGSGVIVSPEGHILTNNHVIEDADDIEVVLADGRRAAAKVIGTDPDTDLALLKITLDKLPVIVLGQTQDLQVGDVVLAIGNPFGVGQTVTSGIVSALGRSQLGINTFENFIQTDAAINPGNSGGALVDVNGNLMGINTAIYSRSGGSMGIGFAIPISTAKQVMQDLLKNGKVIRGWIGVEPQDMSPELAESFQLPKSGAALPSGVVITGVLKNGPAATAGIRPGDVIVKVAGHPVGNVAELLTQVASLKPGVPAEVNVWRRQGEVNLRLTPAERPAANKLRK